MIRSFENANGSFEFFQTEAGQLLTKIYNGMKWLGVHYAQSIFPSYSMKFSLANTTIKLWYNEQNREGFTIDVEDVEVSPKKFLGITFGTKRKDNSYQAIGYWDDHLAWLNTDIFPYLGLIHIEIQGRIEQAKQNDIEYSEHEKQRQKRQKEDDELINTLANEHILL